VRHVAAKKVHGGELRWQASAIEALQLAAEAYLVCDSVQRRLIGEVSSVRYYIIFVRSFCEVPFLVSSSWC
jgi:hypothetical protein